MSYTPAAVETVDDEDANVHAVAAAENAIVPVTSASSPRDSRYAHRHTSRRLSLEERPRSALGGDFDLVATTVTMTTKTTRTTITTGSSRRQTRDVPIMSSGATTRDTRRDASGGDAESDSDAEVAASAQLLPRRDRLLAYAGTARRSNDDGLRGESGRAPDDGQDGASGGGGGGGETRCTWAAQPEQKAPMPMHRSSADAAGAYSSQTPAPLWLSAPSTASPQATVAYGPSIMHQDPRHPYPSPAPMPGAYAPADFGAPPPPPPTLLLPPQPMHPTPASFPPFTAAMVTTGQPIGYSPQSYPHPVPQPVPSTSSSAPSPTFVPPPPNSDAARRTLFIGDIGALVVEDELRDLLARFDLVEHLQIKRDAYTGRSLGFGFVRFATVEGAERARRGAHGAPVGSRRIRLGTAYRTSDILVRDVPSYITTDELRRVASNAHGEVIAAGTYVRGPCARVRFAERATALAVAKRGWCTVGECDEWRSAEWATTAISRNAVEVQFSAAEVEATEARAPAAPDAGQSAATSPLQRSRHAFCPFGPEALSRTFSRFGAVHNVHIDADAGVAYVVFEASARGIAQAKRAMRSVHAVGGVRVWCHPSKVCVDEIGHPISGACAEDIGDAPRASAERREPNTDTGAGDETDRLSVAGAAASSSTSAAPVATETTDAAWPVVVEPSYWRVPEYSHYLGRLDAGDVHGGSEHGYDRWPQGYPPPPIDGQTRAQQRAPVPHATRGYRDSTGAAPVTPWYYD